jgi:hypothetical protein
LNRRWLDVQSKRYGEGIPLARLSSAAEAGELARLSYLSQGNFLGTPSVDLKGFG